MVSFLFGTYIVLSFICLGYFFVSRFIFRHSRPNLAIEFSISLSVGFGVYSLLYYFVYCFASNLSIAFILVLQTFGIALGYTIFIVIYQWSKSFISQIRFPKIEMILWTLLFITVGSFLMLMMFQALTPVKLGDAITGYIETSRWIYHNGFSTYDPYNTKYSTFPALTEVIYSLSFAIHTEIAAKVIDGFFGLAFILAIFGFASQYMNRSLALFCGLTFTMLQQYTWLFGGGKIDMVSQFIAFSGLVCLLLNNKQVFNFRFILLSTFLLGISIAEKYTNVLFLPFFFIYIIYILRWHKYNIKQITGYISLLCGIVFIIILPHFIKDYIWVHNPFAPFINPLFRSDFEIQQHFNGDASFTSWRDTLLFPYYFFIGGKNLPIVILIGLILYVVKKWKSRGKSISPLVFFGLVELFIWMILFKNYWFNERFIFAFIALFFCMTLSEFQDYYVKYKLVRLLLLVYFVVSFTYYVYHVKRFANYAKFITGKQTEAEWEDQNGNKSVTILKSISDSLDSNHKLFTPNWNIMYPISYDKLKFVSTNMQIIEASKSGDIKQYLQEEHYAYIFVYNAGDDIPSFLKKRIVLKDRNGVIYGI